jgi:N-methylhydantoinase A
MAYGTRVDRYTMTTPPYLIGVDVGGTFTDVVGVHMNGHTTLAKALTTPEDPSDGVLAGLARLAEELGLTRQTLLAQTARIVHGTTVATNALLEKRGARVGLLTTAGHRDVLEMREGLKDERYNLRMPAPDPLVPRNLRLGVVERIGPEGQVLTPLDTASLDAAIVTLKRENVTSVAICFLHSWSNAAHEAQAAARVRAAIPSVSLSVSSEVLPKIKEYERVSTTCVNAYVAPIVEGYFTKLQAKLTAAGYGGPVFIMLSHGGVAPIAEATRLAASTVLSGPAGGVAGSQHAATLSGTPNLVTFDMGGTSSDIALVTGGLAELGPERRIAGELVAMPSLDIVTLGAGGGSIARLDAGGVLRVGPESAGANPGPACYGRGGREPTVTDANLVLGLLDPATFLDGRMALDRKAAETAIDRLAEGLGLDRMQAAAGIVRVVDARMAEGIRIASVRRGVDPRNYALLAFGGAAGLHVTGLARELDITRVIVPRVASVLSAWGMLTSDVRTEILRTHFADAGTLEPERLRALYAEMEAEGRGRLGPAFGDKVRFERSADMRYGEQIFEIGVPLDHVSWNAGELAAQIAEAFHARHEQLFTYALRDREAVIVNLRVSAIGGLPVMPSEPQRGEPERSTVASAGVAATRRIYLDGWKDVPVVRLDALPPGTTIQGPAIVDSTLTTVRLGPGDRARVTPIGWLDIAVAR